MADDTTLHSLDRRLAWVAILLVLLLAAGLRLSLLGGVPPGLAHDEVANWLIAKDILRGQHAIYFTAAYGHEPLYQYLQAASVALFGDHWLGVRYPSAALGLVGLVVTYVLVRRMFSVKLALLVAAWLAVSFWPLFYARVGVRAILLPLTSALSVYFMQRALGIGERPPPVGSRFADWLLAGLFLGLSLYTYMAARILPVITVAFLVYVLLVRPRARALWRAMVLMLVVAALVSAPLVAWLVSHPGAEYRVREVQKPLTRLLAGDPSMVWENLLANLKFFTIAGDPWSRQNVPGRPVFADLLSATLFYLGLIFALWRWRDPRYGFLVIWLAGALVPSVATLDAPSSIRDILALVVVFVFPALPVVEACRWLRSRRPTGGPGDRLRVIGRWSLFLLPLTLTMWLTVRDYFVLWPRNDVVRFDYQSDLTAVAHRLDELPPDTPVAVAGISVHTMDGPGLELAARRAVHDIRLSDTRETLVVPRGPDAWLFVPGVVPLDAHLRERLEVWGAVRESSAQPAFASYRLPDDATQRRHEALLDRAVSLPGDVLADTPIALPVSFGGRLSFLGYERVEEVPRPGGRLTLLTYWRVEEVSPAPLKIFIHLLDEAGTSLAQHDGLGSPPRGWAPGDTIIQKHVISLPASLHQARYTLQLGVYEPTSGARLPVLTVDRLLLYSFAATE